MQPNLTKYLFLILFITATSKTKAQLNAAFSASVKSGCASLKVGFSDASTGSPTQWFWDFGDGQTSELKNPTATYKEAGTYTVRLIVKNNNGQDYEEKKNYIKVYPTPKTVFKTAGTTLGCIPLNISFINKTDTTGINVAGLLWNFGDGTTSSLQNPVHMYTTAGSFDVSLTIQSAEGCSNTDLQPGIVQTGSKPVADFTASPLDGCASVTRNFINTSSGSFTTALWSFGDGTASTDISPAHHFVDTGWLSVRLIIEKNGCADTNEKLNYIHIQGPAAKINKIVDCENRLDLTFKDASVGETSTQWDLGDGTTSGLKTVMHTYPYPGKYKVALNVSNGTCNDTTSNIVYIPSVKPEINYFPKQPFYCKGDSIQLLFTDYDKGSEGVFAWNFGNSDSVNYSTNNDSIFYVYTTNGRFRPSAFMKDQERCVDTLLLGSTLIIKGPIAAFTRSSSPPVCTDKGISFKDNSATGDAPLAEWEWSYGDGTTGTGSTAATYNYAFPGKYNVGLKVTDTDGCTDTITHSVLINKTPEIRAHPDKLLCLGQSDTLTATGANTYTWSTNSNIICNSCTNPVVSPKTPTTYYVQGTNASGCSAADTTIITIQSKQPISVYASGLAICAGEAAQLSAYGTDAYSWSPATALNNDTIRNPVATPVAGTVYTVIGKDSNACFADTATVNIIVNPLPTVDIPADNITVPAGSAYQLQATAGIDVVSYQWTPSTGLSCYNCLNPVATVNKSGIYTLTVVNANGCSSKDSIRLNTICNSDMVFVPNTFSPNNDGTNDYFFPNSKPSINVKSMYIYNRWGQKVFEKLSFLTNSYNSGWNGKYDNLDQVSDVYIYIIEFLCADGNKVVMKGNVSLLR